MGAFDGLKRKIRSVDTDVLAREAIYSQEKIIVYRNQMALNRGERDNTTTITPSYSKLTKEIKQKKGQPTDRVTLFDTGKFYRRMALRLRRRSFSIISTDSKSLALQQKYDALGGSVLGLQMRDKAWLSRVVSEMVSRKIKQQL
jgi:hypothetical protein